MKKEIAILALILILVVGIGVIVILWHAKPEPVVNNNDPEEQREQKIIYREEENPGAFYVQELKKYGVFEEDEEINLDEEIKVSEFLKIVCLAYWPNSDVEEGYDKESLSHWAQPYVIALDGIMIKRREYTPNVLEKTITREEVANLLTNLLNYIGKSKNRTIEWKQDMAVINEVLDVQDISSDNGKIYLDNCLRLGLMEVFEDNTIRPNESITKLEASRMIYKVISFFN